MALLWLDGFESYGTTTGVAPSPTGIMSASYPVAIGETNFDIEAGRYGNYSIEVGSYLSYFQTAPLTTDDTLIFGVAFKFVSMPTAQRRELIKLYEGAFAGLHINVETSGALSVYKSFTHLSTSLETLTTNTWHYLEFKVVSHLTTGSYELRVNNLEWTSKTNTNTVPNINPYHNVVRLGAMFAINVFWDDFYVLDSTGSGANDFLGDRQVTLFSPDGNGDTNDFTPLSGNNYENVDEVERDDDTSYNESNTANDIELYEYADAAGLTTIDGIKIISDIRVTTGSMDVRTLIKSGGTTSEGTPETITSSTYVNQHRISEEDPNTVTAWTQSGLNAAQFGVKIE